ncbi:MAG: superoxide dismutase [Planctomycetota bacterium]
MNRRQLLGTAGLSTLAAVGATAGHHEGHDHHAAHDHGHGPGHEGHLHTFFSQGYDADKGLYVVPPLPYAYDALEPAIDEQTMRIHHTKHHQGYVNGLNTALAKLANARDANDFGLIRHLSRSVSFNGGGHTLHTLFWNNMAPAGEGGQPSGNLARCIEECFGGMNKLKAHFVAAASGVEGSGWGMLGVDLVSGQLIIVQGENQQKLTTWGFVPILVCDVWEHAYYLNYQNKRKDYVNAFWGVINWLEVAKRYDAAIA